MSIHPVVKRALRSHELALKQAISEHNKAVAEKEKRPFRPVEQDVKRHILTKLELYAIEEELSELAIIRLRNRLT